jgi:hypothetical protein
MPDHESTPAGPTFRKTLLRVMAMQVAALLVLWALQARYAN